MDSLIYRIMAETYFEYLVSLSYDVINGIKKKDIGDQIENLKEKLVVGNGIQGLFK